MRWPRPPTLPLSAARLWIGTGVHAVVHVARMYDQTRKVTHITELNGVDGDPPSYHLQDIFLRVYELVEGGDGVDSDLIPTGMVPARCVTRLVEQGVDLPAGVYMASDLRES